MIYLRSEGDMDGNGDVTGMGNIMVEGKAEI